MLRSHIASTFITMPAMTAIPTPTLISRPATDNARPGRHQTVERLLGQTLRLEGQPAWVVMNTVTPVRFRSARMCSHTERRDCGSRPSVGSSRNSTAGTCRRPRAISKRRRIPPENLSTR